MKVFVALALVCSFWTTSAIPRYSIKEGCEASITTAAYDDTPGKEQILVTYDAVPDCNFIVKCTMNEEELDVTQLAVANMGIVPLPGPLLCDNVVVTVIAVDADGNETPGTEANQAIDPKSPEWGGFEVGQTESDLVINYNEFDSTTTEKCAPAVKVSVGDDPEQDCPDGTCSIPLNDLGTSLSPCSDVPIKVTVTYKNIVDPLEDSKDYNFKVPAVTITDVQTPGDGSEIYFEPLSADIDTSNCGAIAYKVVEKSEKCFASVISVMATYNENANTGIEATKQVQKNPAAVEDLTAEVSGNNVLLSWSAPSGGEKCGLIYHGKVSGQDEPVFEDIHATTTTFTLPNPIEACKSTTISVFSKLPSHDEDSVEASVEIFGALGKVLNLACETTPVPESEDNKVTCKWDSSVECEGVSNVKYNVRYYNGNEVQSAEINTRIFDYTITCGSDLWFSVTPILGSNGVGDVVETIVTCDT